MLNSLRINFKKIIGSASNTSSALTKNIVAELERQGYRITNQTQNSIEFKHDILAFGSRTRVFRKVDGGTFDIIPENKTVVLSYYISPLFEIFASCIIAFLGFTQDYHIFFFVAFIAMMFGIKLMTAKTVANQIMEDMTMPKH